VLNRAGLDSGVREKDVERTLDTELWWKIPQDNEVVKAAQLGRPIVMSRPNSKVSLEIRDIARALAGIRQKSKAQKRGGGFSFGRLFKKSA
jgi:MinD-like ATPase involved in chromosome partitioning or flagellar assembly